MSTLLGRLAARFVWGSLTFFAVWTMAYQIALVVGLRALPTLVLTGVIWAAGATVLARTGTGSDPVDEPTLAPIATSATLLVTLLLTVAGGALAFTGHRGAAVGLAAVAALAGLALAAGHRDRSPEPGSGEERRVAPAFWPLAWALGVVSGGLAAIFARPDGDDAYFVNLSAWVAERGNFPLRDTMISDEVFPALGAHSPPVHSIEALFGVIASLLHLPAGTVTYVLAPPVLTLLAVLSLALLVDHARMAAAPLALLAAVVGLWMSGDGGATIGNFFALRIWQGKSVLVSIVLPLMLLAAARQLERPSWRAHGLLAAATIATIGASNTSVFLTPVLLAGVTLGAWAMGGVVRALQVAALVIYPAVVGAIVVLMAEPVVTDPEVPTRASRQLDPLVAVPGRDGILLLTVLALGLGWAGIRRPALRLASVGALAATTVILLPPVRAVIVDAAGIGSVIWRLWWVVPLPLLAAGVVGLAADLVRRWPDVTRSAVTVAATAAVALVPLVSGRWLGSPQNGARLVPPTAWKVPAGALSGAVFADRVSSPGDTVLVPWDVARVLSGLTVEVHPVSARTFYLPAYAGAPGAEVPARQELQHFADAGTPEVGSLDDELDLLSVDTVCVPASRGRADTLLEEAGFHQVGDEAGLTCLVR